MLRVCKGHLLSGGKLLSSWQPSIEGLTLLVFHTFMKSSGSLSKITKQASCSSISADSIIGLSCFVLTGSRPQLLCIDRVEHLSVHSVGEQ